MNIYVITCYVNVHLKKMEKKALFFVASYVYYFYCTYVQ